MPDINIAIHFGQQEAGYTSPTDGPMMVNQRIYVRSKSGTPETVLPMVMDVLHEIAGPDDDDVLACEIARRLAHGEADGAVRVSPFLVVTQHPVLVFDFTNDMVWVEERDGTPVEGRTWAMHEFMCMPISDVIAALEE
jgi:late competence protein required for DNA uptake (superfamily II DNA/RNA helicase)